MRPCTGREYARTFQHNLPATDPSSTLLHLPESLATRNLRIICGDTIDADQDSRTGHSMRRSRNISAEDEHREPKLLEPEHHPH